MCASMCEHLCFNMCVRECVILGLSEVNPWHRDPNQELWVQARELLHKLGPTPLLTLSPDSLRVLREMRALRKPLMR